ncbi:MAG: TrkH family potassium uptake protein [Candidatus Omnitrophota bacterium]
MIKKFVDYFIGVVAVFALLLLLLENSSYLRAYTSIVSIINFVILIIFITDVVARYALSKDRKTHLKHNWFDLIVFVPLLQTIGGIANTPFFVIIRQVVIVAMLASRLKKSHTLITLLSLKPAQLMITSFGFTIIVGAILLMLPAATKTGMRLPLIDALFTATSATCVTGLIVRDTATYFSLFGQTVILLLIQVGGLGIMTFSVSLVYLLKKTIDMKQGIMMQDVLDQDTLANVKSLIVFIVRMTAIFELTGALVLFIAWHGKFASIAQTLYYALFHSVSAFCNAGFSTFTDSLMGFSQDVPTNIIICGLIIAGGLGFMAIKDLHENTSHKITDTSIKPIKIRVQTKIVLRTTFFLILGGALLIYALERNHAFSAFSMKSKVLLSLFQSITPRTAGFNTCDMARLSPATLFVILVLMFIGGSPGSTAGGIKTTTVAVIWSTIVSSFKRKDEVEIFKRTIPAEVIKKAIIVSAISIFIVVVSGTILLYTETYNPLGILFEAVSAFGTVGLSTGLTPLLSVAGKIVITVLMFIGRLGPLTVAYAFLRYKRAAQYTYAQESVTIG